MRATRRSRLASIVVITATLAFDLQRASAQPMPEDLPEGDHGPRTSRESYDHRAPADRTADEAARWPLRIALAPLRLVVGLARESARAVLEPIHDTASSVEGEDAARTADDQRTPPEPPLLAMPVVHLETERSPAIGVHVRLVPDARVHLDLVAQHWDDARLEGWLLARFDVHEALELRLEGDGGTRSDRIWHGLGWNSADDARTRYRHHRGGAIVGARVGELARGTFAAVEGRFTHHRFDGSGYGGDDEPSIDAQAAGPPSGFVEGATVIEPRARVVVDSRHDHRGSASPGAALELSAAYGADIAGRARWARGEARSAVTVALAREHDLTLSGWATLVEPIGGSPDVPFVERVVLGGEPGRLAGFPLGRLHGDSAAIVHVRYRWGIDPNADAALHFELGNVFGPAFSDFHVERARASFGLSIEGLGDPFEDGAHRLGILFALATDPLVDGAMPSSGHARFFIGAPPR